MCARLYWVSRKGRESSPDHPGTRPDPVPGTTASDRPTAQATVSARTGEIEMQSRTRSNSARLRRVPAKSSDGSLWLLHWKSIPKAAQKCASAPVRQSQFLRLVARRDDNVRRIRP